MGGEGRQGSMGGGSRRRKPSPLLVIGLCLVLVGLVGLGWVGYQYVGTNVVAGQQFASEKERLRSEWERPQGTPTPGEVDPPGTVVPGNAVALLRIPRFGADYEVPLVQGTTQEVLARGVGIYDNAAAPGAIGNFSIAGHRVTHGEPFRRLLELRAGDTVIVETRTEILTYVLDTAPADLTVDESAGWVLDPVPGKPAEKPTRALLTLTTCQDLFHSPDRSVAFGHLESRQNK